jgi:hypothetical protein
MVLLQGKEDFTIDDIRSFQNEIDHFFSDFIDLVGRNGITNYFHLLGSGHISDYLHYYKNLYSHSQQGWEAFNSFLKVFYFRRTNRGGGRGELSRVNQIARWLGRRLVWFSGIEYNMMNTAALQNSSIDAQNSIIHDDMGMFDI